VDTSAGAINCSWVVATHASRTARVQMYAYDTAARECIRIQASGTAPMVGFLGAAAVARQTITGVSSGTPTAAQQAAVIRAILLALGNFGFITDSTT
jgi:hypothetical protein